MSFNFISDIATYACFASICWMFARHLWQSTAPATRAVAATVPASAPIADLEDVELTEFIQESLSPAPTPAKAITLATVQEVTEMLNALPVKVAQSQVETQLISNEIIEAIAAMLEALPPKVAPVSRLEQLRAKHGRMTPPAVVLAPVTPAEVAARLAA